MQNGTRWGFDSILPSHMRAPVYAISTPITETAVSEYRHFHGPTTNHFARNCSYAIPL
jgi:hypothetical protein